MNFIKLRISGNNIDFEHLRNTLGIAPKFTCKKGDTCLNKITKRPTTYSEDCWIYVTEVENESETEDKMAEFVDLLYENRNFVCRLSSMYHVTLWLTLNLETHQYNLRFSHEVLNKISELEIDTDITCMQLQDFYEGTY